MLKNLPFLRSAYTFFASILALKKETGFLRNAFEKLKNVFVSGLYKV